MDVPSSGSCAKTFCVVISVRSGPGRPICFPEGRVDRVFRSFPVPCSDWRSTEVERLPELVPFQRLVPKRRALCQAGPFRRRYLPSVGRAPRHRPKTFQDCLPLWSPKRPQVANRRDPPGRSPWMPVPGSPRERGLLDSAVAGPTEAEQPLQRCQFVAVPVPFASWATPEISRDRFREARCLASVLDGWIRRVPQRGCILWPKRLDGPCRARIALLPKRPSGARLPSSSLLPKRPGGRRLPACVLGCRSTAVCLRARFRFFRT